MALESLLAQVSTPAHQYEILKIIIDKGAIAVIVLIIGVAINLILERYKSILAREQEISKITNPMILGMIASSEQLYQEGATAIREGASDFWAFENWCDSMLKAPLNLKRTSFLDLVNEGRSAKILVGTGTSTLEDFIAGCAANEELIALVSSDFFWNDPHVIGTDDSLVLHLYSARLNSSVAPTLHFWMANYYSKMERPYKIAYRKALDKFRFEMLRNLYPEGKGQEKAYENILTLLTTQSEVMGSFPAVDVATYRGFKQADSTLNMLTESHGAIVSQLGAYLRSR